MHVSAYVRNRLVAETTRTSDLRRVERVRWSMGTETPRSQRRTRSVGLLARTPSKREEVSPRERVETPADPSSPQPC
jgi:hypothetical protein